MNITINFKKKAFPNKSSNLIFFVDENYNLNIIKKYISKLDYSYIFDLLKTKDFSKNINFFDINSKKSIILVSLKKKHKVFSNRKFRWEFL